MTAIVTLMGPRGPIETFANRESALEFVRRGGISEDWFLVYDAEK